MTAHNLRTSAQFELPSTAELNDMLSALATWLVNYSLGKSADALVATFAPRELDGLLTAAVQRWANALPADCAVHPDALFCPPRQSDQGAAAAAIQERLVDGSMPTTDEWYAALRERWQAVSHGIETADLQPFFRLNPTAAESHLRELAARLHAACVQNEALFRTSVAEALRNIEANTRKGTARGASIVLRDVDLPPYDSAATIEFVIHNSSEKTLLVSRLSVQVIGCAPIPDVRTVKAGAPVRQIELRAHIEPEQGSVQLTPQQFVYAPNATDFFRLRLTATPGWEYHAAIEAKQAAIPEFSESVVRSAEFWLYVPTVI